jgi:hypothetical protein
MRTPPGVATRRSTRRSPITSLVLMALAVTALAAACVMGHDPRDDGSRQDAHPRNAAAIATQIETV